MFSRELPLWAWERDVAFTQLRQPNRVIEQIVAGQKPELTGNQSRFLSRRGLITADGTLAFPILARWLNEYAE